MRKIFILTLTILCLLCLTACNDDVIVEQGTITEKIYGHPVYEEKGEFTFYIAGDVDYFIYVENEEEGQWFRVLNVPLYMELTVGDSFIYDAKYYKPVTSFLDRY